MQCTADFCQGRLVHDGGENTEDYGCSNWKHPRMSCPVSLTLDYYTAVKVRTGWYFLAEYHLPFIWNDEWFVLVGNPNGRTVLQKLEPYRQRELYSIDYVALPANDDFKARFNELRDRVMGEWSGTRAGTIVYTWYDDLITGYNERVSNYARAQIPSTQYGEEIERSPFGLFPPQQEEVERTPSIEWPLPFPTIDHARSFNLVPSPHRTLMTMDSLTGDVSGPTPKTLPQVKTNTQISIDAEVLQLIETATSDTADEAAEHAAIEACKKLKRKLNG